MGQQNIQSVVVQDDVCMIAWSDGLSSEFHLLWLRDNCPCADCMHPETRERIFDIMSVPQDLLPPENVKTPPGHLYFQWPDGHESQYSTDWLKQHCYSDRARAERRSKPVLWDRQIAAAVPEVNYSRIMSSDEGLYEWLDTMIRFGFCLIRETPTEEGEVMKVAGRVSFLRESNFGSDFDVVSKANPNNVAYTALQLQSHSDLPYWQRPPGTQFLHCLISEAEGGESTLVDGFNAARLLQQQDSNAYELLKSQSIPFRFHDDEWDISWTAPTIRCDAEDQLNEIRYHSALTAPLDIPADNVLPFYKAYRQLTEIIRAPENILQIRLAPGDLMVFDNGRALHGRMSFDPSTGRRHLQGCYVDNDAIRSKHRILQRKLKINP